MSITVTLNTIGNLQDTTTAQTQLNQNNSSVVAGFTSAFNSTGDKMLGNIDMNSNQMINLPAPGSANSPVRLQDVISNTSPISISSVPPTGTSGAVVGFLNGNNTWSGTNNFSTNNVTTSNIVTANITTANVVLATITTAVISGNGTVNGTLTVATGSFTNQTTSNPIVVGNSTVTALPAASTYKFGRYMANDATSTTFGAVVAGGSTLVVPVWSNGTNWLIG